MQYPNPADEGGVRVYVQDAGSDHERVFVGVMTEEADSAQAAARFAGVEASRVQATRFVSSGGKQSWLVVRKPAADYHGDLHRFRS